MICQSKAQQKEGENQVGLCAPVPTSIAADCKSQKLNHSRVHPRCTISPLAVDCSGMGLIFWSDIFFQKSSTPIFRVLRHAAACFNRWCLIPPFVSLCVIRVQTMFPPKSPQARPLETPLELGDPNWTGGDLEGDLPGSCGSGEGPGAFGGGT